MLKKIQTYVASVNFESEIARDKHRLALLVFLEVCMIVVTLFIQEYLRPKDFHFSAFGVSLLGILPSFLGATAYVLILFAIHKLIQSYHQRFRLNQSILFANSISFFGLTLWELIRSVIHRFDWGDVAATLAGCAAASILIYALYYKSIMKKR